MIIGLDVGGTHTDVVLLNTQGLIKEIKVTTDHADLFNTVLRGLDHITQGIDPHRIKRIVLSTTLTTNAIVQHQLAPVGMIVSSGPGIDPEFFRPNQHYFPISGCMDHRGREITPVNAAEINSLAAQLKSAGIRYVGVVGKFATRNPSHELCIQNQLNGSFEKIFVGHKISGNLGFPRRIATTYLNAAVYPIHKEFFEAVTQSLQKKEICAPIRILKADGGNTRFESSIAFPGQTILSGPAASVLGSMSFAAPSEESMVMDIGGTTTDLAVLINRVPLLKPQGITIDQHKTLIRSLDTLSIGVGGDSAVQLVDGRLHVGPQRKGAAMAFGGPAPTPTDALFVMGEMSDGDGAAAKQGIAALARKMHLTVEDTAAKILDVACQKILDGARNLIDRINRKPVYTVHELQEGYLVKPQHLLILGGPAPHFAKRLKQISNYKVNVVPRWKIANAIGAALARTTSQVTLLADTEQAIAIAPEEGFRMEIGFDYTRRQAIDSALNLLRQKALQKGANPEHLEMDVHEEIQFNMVRGFNTTGKNIRVKVQIKPGLIAGYDLGPET